MTLLGVTVGQGILAWIGILVLLVVAVVVVILFNRTLRPAFEINAYADDILQGGLGIARNLDAVEELERTRQLANRVPELAEGYLHRVRGT